MAEHLRTDYDRMVGESYRDYAARCRGRMLAAEQDRDTLAAEVRQLQADLGFEAGMRTAAVDELESLRRALWELIAEDQLSDQATLRELQYQCSLVRHWHDKYERLHTWNGLMSLLDEHYPADVPLGPDSDPGPRILALIRALDERDRQITEQAERMRALGEDWLSPDPRATDGGTS